jgi:26S proteasome regulatory subunit N9
VRPFLFPVLSFCPQSVLRASPDPAQHLEFLTDLLSRIAQDKSPDAHVLVLSTLAHAKLLFGDLEGSKTDIDAAWKILDNLDAVDNSVNGAYYRVAADYYKVRSVWHEDLCAGAPLTTL